MIFSEILQKIKPYVLGWISQYLENNGYLKFTLNHQTWLNVANWNGKVVSTTAKTKINLNSEFGVPSGIKGVFLYCSIADSGFPTGDAYLGLSPNNIAGDAIFFSPAYTPRHGRYFVFVPCDSDGNIYYQVLATGTNTATLYIQVWGWVSL